MVYRLDAAGQYTVLHTFVGRADGVNPFAGVVRDSAGNLYGTTLYGGPANAGVVYKVDPAGRETVLHSFTGGADGGLPYAGLTLGPAGSLYGAASSGGITNSACPVGCGVVFTLDAAGQFTVLHSFTGADGNDPHAGVILDPAGNIYGTTYEGGASGGGVVYEMDPAGQVTVLYNFTGGADGGEPSAGVIHDSNGNLFGTTFGGGTAYYGTVYKLDTSGQETVLHSFPGWGRGAPTRSRCNPRSVGKSLRDRPQGWSSGLWRGLQAGYDRQLHGAVQLQLRIGRAPTRRRCDPRLGRQSLWDHYFRREVRLGRSL